MVESHRSGMCPTFFRGCVARARTSRVGYSDAGYHLMIHIFELVGDEVHETAITELRQAVDGADYERIWEWLRRTVPRCMALIPSRRKATFLRGIEAAIEEGRV